MSVSSFLENEIIIFLLITIEMHIIIILFTNFIKKRKK